MPDPRTQIDSAALVREAMGLYESQLIAYAANILSGDTDRARDVVQDTFLRLFQAEPDRVRENLKAWLYTVCRNRALDVQRKASRMTPLTDIEMDHRPAPGPSPADAATTRDDARRIEELLGDLPFNQREVVRLKFQNQLSYQEIAAITSLSEGNVGFLLHTALKTLRSRLAKLESRTVVPT